jgi:glycosyltransferase involved in cell wall biosynthesis
MRAGKILHVVQNEFLRDSRVLREVKSLSDVGYRVRVLALQDEENRLARHEKKDGFTVERVRLRSRKLPKRLPFQLIKYIEYLILSSLRVKRFNPRIVHCHDLNTLFVGIISGRIVIYDSHEFQRGRNRLSRARSLFIGIYEDILVRKVNAVITVNEQISKLLANRFGKKTAFLLNANNRKNLDIQEVGPDVPAPLHERLGLSGDKKIIIYPGRFSHGRGLFKVLDAAKYLDSRIVVVLMGYGPLENNLKDAIEKKGLSGRIYMVPAVPHEYVSSYIATCDLGIMPTENTCVSYELGLGNKFFHFVSAGIPIGVSDQPAKRFMVEKYGIGIVFDPENPSEMAECINNFLSDSQLQKEYRENVKKARAELNWEVEEEKLLSLYSELLAKD